MFKGLEELRKRSEQQAAQDAQKRISRVFLRDGDRALLRFLTDVNDVVIAKFHNIEEITIKGKQFRDKLCTRESTGICQYCATGNAPGTKIFLWAYVYNILHKQQNPKLSQDPNAPKWPQKKSPAGVFYQEVIDGVRLFAAKPGKSRVFQNLLLQYADEDGSLLLRDYVYSRNGSGLDTTYTLATKNPAEMTEEIKKLIPALPSLEDAVAGKITTFGQEKGSESPAAEVVDGESGDSGEPDMNLF